VHDNTIDQRVARLEAKLENEIAAIHNLVSEMERLTREVNTVRLELRELIVITQTERRLLKAAAAILMTVAGAVGWLASFLIEHWRR
jgi:hypothetical protein